MYRIGIYIFSSTFSRYVGGHISNLLSRPFQRLKISPSRGTAPVLLLLRDKLRVIGDPRPPNLRSVTRSHPSAQSGARRLGLTLGDKEGSICGISRNSRLIR